MKLAFLLPFICFYSKSSHVKLSITCLPDTTIITHMLDGNLTEWPAEKIMTDKPTRMVYAVDNNSETLFLAIKISDQGTQKKIMQEGLSLYVDTKGKKKENRGIEFPMRMEGIASIEGMKIFGFSGIDSRAQSLRTAGLANVAIAWDSAFVMTIEYDIPLKMLEGTIAELNNKKLSIGWKIEQSDVPVATSQAATSSPQTVTRVVGVPAGSRPSGNRTAPIANSNASNVNNSPAMPSGSNKSQSVWTSHTISF